MNWVDIKGYEGLYQINNTGQIKSLRKGMIMKLADVNGYLCVTLLNYRKEKKQHKLHRLIYQHFKGDCEGKIIDHIDRNKHNNKLENLRTVTPKENVDNTTYPYKPPITKVGNIFVLKMRMNGIQKHIGCFRTYGEAEEKYKEKYKEREKIKLL